MAPVSRAAALCGSHRAIRSILGGAHGHCVPSAPPKDAAPIAGAEKSHSSTIVDDLLSEPEYSLSRNETCLRNNEIWLKNVKFVL